MTTMDLMGVMAATYPMDVIDLMDIVGLIDLIDLMAVPDVMDVMDVIDVIDEEYCFLGKNAHNTTNDPSILSYVTAAFHRKPLSVTFTCRKLD